MLRFARNKLHRELMSWIVEGDGKNAQGGVRPPLRRAARAEATRTGSGAPRAPQGYDERFTAAQQGDRRPVRPPAKGRLTWSSAARCRARASSTTGSRSPTGSTRTRRSSSRRSGSSSATSTPQGAVLPPRGDRAPEHRARRRPSSRARQRTRTRSSTRSSARGSLLFGFTEFVDDDEAFESLVAALEERARRIGATRLLRAGEPPAEPVRRRRHVGLRGARLRRRAVQPRLLPDATTSGTGSSAASRARRSSSLGLDRGPGLPPFDPERIERERLEVRPVNRRRMQGRARSAAPDARTRASPSSATTPRSTRTSSPTRSTASASC